MEQQAVGTAVGAPVLSGEPRFRTARTDSIVTHDIPTAVGNRRPSELDGRQGDREVVQYGRPDTIGPPLATTKYVADLADERGRGDREVATEKRSGSGTRSPIAAARQRRLLRRF